MQTAKEVAKQMIDRLPDQASWENILYELYIKQKIEAGLTAMIEGQTVPHKDALRGAIGLTRLHKQTKRQGYPGEELATWVKDTFACELEIVKRTTKAFKVLPRRWVVERTFAWLSRYRRLVRVYEKRAASSIAMIWVASTRILLKKLYPSPDKESVLN